MHTEMWQHPATVANMATLRARGVHLVGPASGQLTGHRLRPGRMAGADDIVAAALAALRPRDLAGRRLLVTAGGTREPLDPVRFLGNRSSGKQGVAIARAAAARGADGDARRREHRRRRPVRRARLLGAATCRRPPSLRERRPRGGRDGGRRRSWRRPWPTTARRPWRPAKIKKETQGDDARPASRERNPDILTRAHDDRAAPGQTRHRVRAPRRPRATSLLELGRAKAAAARASTTSSSTGRVGRGFRHRAATPSSS